MLGRATWLRTRFDRPAAAADQATSGSAARMARDALGEQAYDAAARRGAAIGLGSVS